MTFLTERIIVLIDNAMLKLKKDIRKLQSNHTDTDFIINLLVYINSEYYYETIDIDKIMQEWRTTAKEYINKQNYPESENPIP
jgi:hypothetical protein